MKLIGAISTTVLTLSLGISIPAYAQQDQHEQKEESKDKPAQEKEKKAQPEKSAKPEEKNARQQEKSAKPEERTAQEQHQQARPEQKEAHAGGGRIPADRYKANFGREHSFRVSEGDYRNHRFQYGGYWFGFESAWPSNWLYSQDVYVVEIDGVYYLCNASYPGVNLILNVTM